MEINIQERERERLVCAVANQCTPFTGPSNGRKKKGIFFPPQSVCWFRRLLFLANGFSFSLSNLQLFSISPFLFFFFFFFFWLLDQARQVSGVPINGGYRRHRLTKEGRRPAEERYIDLCLHVPVGCCCCCYCAAYVSCVAK